MNSEFLKKIGDTSCLYLHQDRTKGEMLFISLSIVNYSSRGCIINTSFLSSIPDLSTILIYVTQ